MESELRALEERVGQLAAIARQLRADNLELRHALLNAQNEARTLREKVETASVRLQAIARSPAEDAA
jgi:hypothetical protein